MNNRDFICTLIQNIAEIAPGGELAGECGTESKGAVKAFGLLALIVAIIALLTGGGTQ